MNDTIKKSGFEVHIKDDTKKEGTIQFISWSNPWLQKAIVEAAWVKDNERATAIFVDDDGISVKVETIKEVVLKPMRR